MDGTGTGFSLYVGSLDAPAAPHTHDEDDEEEAEAERQRQQEMQGILANAFDDLEESDLLHQSTCYSHLGSGEQRLGISVAREVGDSDQYRLDGRSEVSANRCEDDRGGYGDRYADGAGGDCVGHRYGRKYENGDYDRRYTDRVPATGEHKDSHELSDHSVTPWSERSPSLALSSCHHLPADDLHPTGVHLNLDCDDSYYALPERIENLPRRSELVAITSAATSTESRVGVSNVTSVRDFHLDAETPYGQLKELYQVRGRELDRLSAELEQLRADKVQQSSDLHHEITLLKAEKERLEVSRSQSQILLTEKESQVRSLQADYQETQAQLTDARTTITKLTVKLGTTESLIKSLEQNICDLQTVDSLANSRRMHEDFLTKLQSNHQDELNSLRGKLSSVQHDRDDLQHRINELQSEVQLSREKHDCVMAEKTRVINELRAGLDARQQQCDALLSAGTSLTIHQLREAVETLTEDKKCLEKELERANVKIEERKEDLESYDTALKLRLLTSVLPSDDSMAHLKIGAPKQLTYEDTLPNADQEVSTKESPLLQGEELVKKLQEELQRYLHIIKHKRDRINDANREVMDQSNTIRLLRKQLKSYQVDVKEQQASIKQISNENNKLQAEMSELQPKCASVLAENTHLKEELSLVLKQVSILQNSGESLSELFFTVERNSKDGSLSPSDITGLSAAVAQHTDAVQQAQHLGNALWTQLCQENAQLLRDKVLWSDRLCTLITSLESLKLKLLQVDALSDANKRSVTAELSRIFDDFKEYVEKIKSEHTDLFVNFTTAQNDLWTVKLALQKLQNKDVTSQRKINELSKDLTEERQNREQLCADSLESAKQTYLSFHEQAIASVKQEYSALRAKLEAQIDSLTAELTDVKARYVVLGKEKRFFEEQLEAANGDEARRESSISSDQVRLAINAMAKKYDEQLQLVKHSHAIELQAYQSSTVTHSKEVQTSLAIDSEHKEMEQATHYSSLANFLPENNELESIVKIFGEQLTSIKSKLTEQIERIQQGQGMQIQQVTNCLESFLEKYLELENQISAALTKNITTKHPSRNFDLDDCEDKFIRETRQDIIGDYKNIIEKIHKEKIDIKTSYEKKINVLLAEHQAIIQSNQKLITESLEVHHQHMNADIELKDANIAKLQNEVLSLRKQIKNISADNEAIVSKLSDEIQNLESAAHANSLNQIRFDREVATIKMEKLLAKDEVSKLKRQLIDLRTESINKTNRLKDKCRRLLANFEKIKEGSIRQVEECMAQARHLKRDNEHNRRCLLRTFDDWLRRNRALLEAGVRRMVQCCAECAAKEGGAVEKTLKDALRAGTALLNTLERFRLDDSVLKILEEESLCLEEDKENIKAEDEEEPVKE